MKEYKYYLVKTNEDMSKIGFDLVLNQDEVELLRTLIYSALNYEEYYPEVQEKYEQLSLKLDFISKIEVI